MTASTGAPELVVQGSMAKITLRRPAQRNRLQSDDLHALLRHFAQVEADAAVRVLLITSSTQGQPRPVFCAGYEVGGFDDTVHDPQLFARVADTLECLRPVTLAAVNGSVYGGATDLVLACDLRVGLAGCEWRMPALALGLHYYPTGLRRYVARLGLPLAQRAFLSAQALGFDQLQVGGVLQWVLSAAEFDEHVQNLVRQVCALAPLAAQATKQSLLEVAAGQFDLVRLHQREAITLASADFAEGRTAFAERRAPVFRGQ